MNVKPYLLPSHIGVQSRFGTIPFTLTFTFNITETELGNSAKFDKIKLVQFSTRIGFGFVLHTFVLFTSQPGGRSGNLNVTLEVFKTFWPFLGQIFLKPSVGMLNQKYQILTWHEISLISPSQLSHYPSPILNKPEPDNPAGYRTCMN